MGRPAPHSAATRVGAPMSARSTVRRFHGPTGECRQESSRSGAPSADRPTPDTTTNPAQTFTNGSDSRSHTAPSRKSHGAGRVYPSSPGGGAWRSCPMGPLRSSSDSDGARCSLRSSFRRRSTWPAAPRRARIARRWTSSVHRRFASASAAATSMRIRGSEKLPKAAVTSDWEVSGASTTRRRATTRAKPRTGRSSRTAPCCFAIARSDCTRRQTYREGSCSRLGGLAPGGNQPPLQGSNSNGPESGRLTGHPRSSRVPIRPERGRACGPQLERPRTVHGRERPEGSRRFRRPLQPILG